MIEKSHQIFAGSRGVGSRLVRTGRHRPSSTEQVHAPAPSQALLQAPVKPLHTNGSSPCASSSQALCIKKGLAGSLADAWQNLNLEMFVVLLLGWPPSLSDCAVYAGKGLQQHIDPAQLPFR